MRHTQLTLGGRLRAAFIGGGASLVIVGTTLAGTALAADQPTTTATTATQTSAAAQTPEALVLDMTEPPYSELPNPYQITTVAVAPTTLSIRPMAIL